MRGRGFTLIELLLVVAILGIIVVAAAPFVGPALSGGRISTAARELASAGRYARTMALMNATPVDLVVDLDAGTLRVEARERDAASRFGMSDLAAYTNAVGYTEELLRTSARRSASLSGGFGLAVSHEDAEAGALTNALERLREEGAEDVEDRVSLADSIRFERSFSGVRLRFDGYADTPLSRRRGEEPGGAAESGTVAIRYRANGTVRPHRWYVCDEEDEDDRFLVTVNAVGRPALHPEGREER